MRFTDKPYTLTSRKRSGRLRVWYFYYRDRSGERHGPWSTGVGYRRDRDRVSSKREAEAVAETRVTDLDSQGLSTLRATPTLRHRVERTAFWDYDQSTYVARVLARSPDEKPGITCGTPIEPRE